MVVSLFYFFFTFFSTFRSFSYIFPSSPCYYVSFVNIFRPFLIHPVFQILFTFSLFLSLFFFFVVCLYNLIIIQLSYWIFPSNPVFIMILIKVFLYKIFKVFFKMCVVIRRSLTYKFSAQSVGREGKTNEISQLSNSGTDSAPVSLHWM